jgi:glycosyltransferase involved in cell wall biosynthesis
LGVFVDPDDDEGFERELEKLIDHSGIAREYGSQLREFAKVEYSSKRVAKQYLELLSSISGERQK